MFKKGKLLDEEIKDFFFKKYSCTLEKLMKTVYFIGAGHSHDF